MSAKKGGLSKASGGALEQAARLLDLPGDVIAGLPRIQITGCREIFIENHKGVLLYEHDDIQIGCGEVILKLRGDELTIAAINATELLIRGRIFGVDFEY